MRKTLLLLIMIGLCPASNAEIYRWKDESGRVVFGERPPPQGADKVELPGLHRHRPKTLPDAFERRERQRRLLESYEYERERKEAEEARAAKRSEALANECRRIRARWRKLSFPGPIYYGEKGGERRYLDDAEREAEKSELRPAYQQACGKAP